MAESLHVLGTVVGQGRGGGRRILGEVAFFRRNRRRDNRGGLYSHVWLSMVVWLCCLVVHRDVVVITCHWLVVVVVVLSWCRVVRTAGVGRLTSWCRQWLVPRWQWLVVGLCSARGRGRAVAGPRPGSAWR